MLGRRSHLVHGFTSLKFQNLIGMLGRKTRILGEQGRDPVSKPYRYARKVFFNALMKKVSFVSKPYRYARKATNRYASAAEDIGFKTLQVCQEEEKKYSFRARLTCFKTLQVCQEVSMIFSNMRWERGFKTLQVCQEGYIAGRRCSNVGWFQNLIGMLGRKFRCLFFFQNHLVSKPYRYARKLTKMSQLNDPWFRFKTLQVCQEAQKEKKKKGSALYVSKPYRYARKEFERLDPLTKARGFKTLQVCQEDIRLIQHQDQDQGFKTLQVCQEG